MASIDYPVLRRPRLKGGIGGNTAVLLWSCAGLTVLAVGLPWGTAAVIPAMLVHGVLLWAYRSDPAILQTYARYASMQHDYQAGIPYSGADKDTRPDGFGKGVGQ